MCVYVRRFYSTLMGPPKQTSSTTSMGTRVRPSSCHHFWSSNHQCWRYTTCGQVHCLLLLTSSPFAIISYYINIRLLAVIDGKTIILIQWRNSATLLMHETSWCLRKFWTNGNHQLAQPAESLRSSCLSQCQSWVWPLLTATIIPLLWLLLAIDR